MGKRQVASRESFVPWTSQGVYLTNLDAKAMLVATSAAAHHFKLTQRRLVESGNLDQTRSISRPTPKTTYALTMGRRPLVILLTDGSLIVECAEPLPVSFQPLHHGHHWLFVAGWDVL